MHAIGIDIGGTKIAGALVNEAGQILREKRIPTPANDPSELVKAVADLIQELSAGEQVLGAGVAAAGFIDANQSHIIYAPNLSWRNEPFKARLEQQVSIPVIIENDANAAGWAEYKFGAGQGYRHMVLLTIGTGVGGAIITDGKMLRGGFGVAGELGHIGLIPDGLLCGCGQHGCLEAYGSGTALVRTARELAESGDPAGKRLRELQKQNGNLGGDEVYMALVEGDPGAIGLLNQLGEWIGKAVASLSVVLDPEIVVIGGGVSSAGELLLEPIRKAYREHLPARGFRPELQLLAAEFANNAGVVGAADLARVSLGPKVN